MTLKPFTITALKTGFEPRRIGLLARSRADALLTARELFPDWIVGAIELSPEWQDDPA